MSSADLFSFLDDAPRDAEFDEIYGDVPMGQEGQNGQDEDSKKRKVEATEPSETLVDPGPSQPKRQRLDSPKPAVVDEVEIEARREVPVVAGLQVSAGEAGARLELRHQVRSSII